MSKPLSGVAAKAQAISKAIERIEAKDVAGKLGVLKAK